MMVNSYELLFAFLRKEICGASQNIDLENISSEQYNTLYKISKSHDLAHIVGSALYSAGVEIEPELSSKLHKAQMVAIYRMTQIGYEQERICQALETAEIPFMPLKGAIIRQYYPNPEARISCDVDIYVKEENLDKAISVLVSELGYKLGQKNIYDVYLYADSGVHIELHFALTERDEKVDAVLEDIWDTATFADKSRYQYIMNNEMFFVYHIAHMAKHFIYGGCGIKPFMDLWIIKNRMGYDADTVNALLKRCGLDVFADAVMLLSDIWFDDAQHTDLTREMEKYIIGAGSYGTVENMVAISQTKSGGRLKYALGRIFQPYSKLKIYYPRLEKHPVLFPYYQVKRWCRILFTKDRDHAFAELKHNKLVSDDKKKRLINLCNNLNL